MASRKPGLPALPVRAVYVRWHDAVGKPGQHARKHILSEIGKGMEMESVGIVLQDNEDGLVIAQDSTPDDEHRNALFIARAMIISVTELGVIA